MKRHRFLPKRIPDGILEGRSPLIRIAPDTKNATALFEKATGPDQSARAADIWLMQALFREYGFEPFERGDLDAGRLNRLFGRELVPADNAVFRDSSFGAILRVNPDLVSEWLDVT